MKLRTRTNQPVEGDELENLKLSGDLEVDGDISGDAITGNSIIENMSGYSFIQSTKEGMTCNITYAGVVKNGNKLTLAIALDITRTGSVSDGEYIIGSFSIPEEIHNKIYPVLYNWIDFKKVYSADNFNSGVDAKVLCAKNSPQLLTFAMYDVNDYMVLNTKYFMRIEETFLLSDNLVPQE